jgi:cytochrome c oxidase subunit 2
MLVDLDRRQLLAGSVLIGLGALLGGCETVAPRERVIRVTARKYDYSPNVIALKLGETVQLEFISLDVIMGFKVPDFGVRTDILPGKVTQLKLTAAKRGTFPFFCDVFCGSGHEEMDGEIVVS